MGYSYLCFDECEAGKSPNMNSDMRAGMAVARGENCLDALARTTASAALIRLRLGLSRNSAWVRLLFLFPLQSSHYRGRCGNDGKFTRVEKHANDTGSE